MSVCVEYIEKKELGQELKDDTRPRIGPSGSRSYRSQRGDGTARDLSAAGRRVRGLAAAQPAAPSLTGLEGRRGRSQTGA
ncbi:hypothetical protein R6Z07F_005146 [Ovis aries]